jgi:hypothetical protein
LPSALSPNYHRRGERDMSKKLAAGIGIALTLPSIFLGFTGIIGIALLISLCIYLFKELK